MHISIGLSAKVRKFVIFGSFLLLTNDTMVVFTNCDDKEAVIAFASITFEVALGTVTNSNPCYKDKGSIDTAFP